MSCKEKDVVIRKLKRMIKDEDKPKYKNPKDLVETYQLVRDGKSCIRKEVEKDYKNYLYKRLRPATYMDYLKWLRGYLSECNEPTHYYDCKFRKYKYYVAKRFFRLGGLYGSNSINVIVPKDVDYKIHDIGHCNVYDMDGYEHKGSWVDIYNDTLEEMEKLIKEYKNVIYISDEM